VIASLKFLDSAISVALILDDDGTWSGPNPWARYLNALSREVDVGPASGDPYVAHVERVAEILGAEVVYEKKKSPSGEVIY
jgi:hypothetical protein